MRAMKQLRNPLAIPSGQIHGLVEPLLGLGRFPYQLQLIKYCQSLNPCEAKITPSMMAGPVVLDQVFPHRTSVTCQEHSLKGLSGQKEHRSGVRKEAQPVSPTQRGNGWLPQTFAAEDRTFFITQEPWSSHRCFASASA